mmetsp:Transcript_26886/g.63063  ORF Transcript_26886/g.63063 Transcript_26886/m.63063 type:complete len:339 (-) Transcript_26886:181-1197(-)
MHSKHLGNGTVILDRIRPKYVPKDSILRGLELVVVQRPLDLPHIVELPLAVANATVQRQDLASHEAGEGKILESPGEGSIDSVSGFARERLQNDLLEAVLLVHGRVLMVSSIEEHLRRKKNLQGKEDERRLHLMLATIHEVPIEDAARAVLGPRHAEGMEQKDQVSQLSMDVAKYLARYLYLCERRLRCKDVLAPVDQGECTLGRLSLALRPQEPQQHVPGIPATVLHILFLRHFRCQLLELRVHLSCRLGAGRLGIEGRPSPPLMDDALRHLLHLHFSSLVVEVVILSMDVDRWATVLADRDLALGAHEVHLTRQDVPLAARALLRGAAHQEGLISR